MDVGLQDRQARYEFSAVIGPRRQERAVGQGRKFEGSDSDVARVDDPVIGEEGRVQMDPAVSEPSTDTASRVEISSTAIQNLSSRIALTSSDM